MRTLPEEEGDLMYQERELQDFSVVANRRHADSNVEYRWNYAFETMKTLTQKIYDGMDWKILPEGASHVEAGQAEEDCGSGSRCSKCGPLNSAVV